MKTFLLFILSALISFTLSTGTVFAHCHKKVISVVAYGTPVTYQVYRACPCRGTWGSPSCNCPDTYIRTSCNSCGVVERQYNYVPGHDGDGYEVYFADPDVYPSPYAYHEDWAYTVGQ